VASVDASIGASGIDAKGSDEASISADETDTFQIIGDGTEQGSVLLQVVAFDQSQGGTSSYEISGAATGQGMFVAQIGDSVTVTTHANASFSRDNLDAFGLSGARVVNLALSGPAPTWTGKGPDALWSDGANWLGGVAPSAGQALLFPSGAQKLSNQNDLGFSFGSVTIADNYTFSGQPLTVTGNLDFQNGSAVLSCSATAHGTISVDVGASLTVGAQGTLDDEGSLTIAANASLTNNHSLTVGPQGTLDDEGSLTIAANASLTNNHNLTVGPQGTLDDQGSLVVQLNGSLDVFGKLTVESGILHGGTLDDSGALAIESGADLEDLGTVVVRADGILTLQHGSMMNVGGGTLVRGLLDIFGRGYVETSATLNVLGDIKVEDTGGLQVSGTINLSGEGLLPGTLVDLHSVIVTSDGTFLNSGLVLVGNGAELSDLGHFTQSILGSIFNSGMLTVAAGASLNDQGGITVKSDGTFDVEGKVNHGATTDTIDVYGKAIVGPMGYLGVHSGGMTIEQGATLIEPDAAVINNQAGVQVDGQEPLENFGQITVGKNRMLQPNFLDNSGQIAIGQGGLLQGYQLSNSGQITNDQGGVLDFNQNDNSGTISNSGLVQSEDTITIEAGASLIDDGTVELLSPDGKLDQKPGSTVIVGPTGLLSDQDAITISAGATLDVHGTLREGAGGHLDVFGTVTIEHGAALNDFTTITVHAGGLLDVAGALSVNSTSSLDIFGVVTIEPGATYSPLGTVTIEPGGILNLPNQNGPVVTDYLVLFGSHSYSLVQNSGRLDLPWQITGIEVVFSEAITSADANSLSGLSATGFSGLGATTLTWTFAAISDGTVAAMLLANGGDALKDAAGNALNAGTNYTQNFKVLLGDVNGDGVVDSADLALANSYRNAGIYNIFADVLGDSVVDLADVLLIRDRIGNHL
jgi:hypothetical protein